MDKPSKRSLHRLLLLLWLTVGAGLRFAQLEAKPPWSDEWATIVYSLGHTFATVPLDRIISLDTMLQPLQLDSMQGTGAVIHYLMRDSTHPPLYFVLSHWWIKLLSPQEGLISIGIARSLSALLGVAAIPAMFGVGWIGFRSRLVGQMAAALMAVSPYGIYLAQEGRHYTLAILWAIASLGCLVVAVRHVNEKTPPPAWVILVWVGVNSLGMATHYFFSLALAAEFLVLLSVWLVDKRFSAGWIRIYGAAVGTLAGVFGWFPALRRIPGNDLTDWIYDNPLGDLAPIGQMLAWIVTMPFMLPVEGTPLIVTVLSGLAIMIFLIWLLPSVVRSLPLSLSVRVLGGYAIASIALVLGVTYLFGADLTVAARFQFNYFPAILLLLGASLAFMWQRFELPRSALGSRFRAKGKTAVIVALVMGLLGGLTVVSNFGYQKFERPDLLIPVMIEAQNTDPEPILIATTYQSYGQTAEMMGLAWQFGQLQQTKQNNYLTSPQFLLARRDNSQHATQVLQQAVRQTPLQLWLVNFSAPVELDAQCAPDSQFKGKVPGYRYRLYRCLS